MATNRPLHDRSCQGLCGRPQISDCGELLWVKGGNLRIRDVRSCVKVGGFSISSWAEREAITCNPRFCDALLHFPLTSRRIGRQHMHKSWMVSSPMLVEAQWVRSTLALISQTCMQKRRGRVLKAAGDSDPSPFASQSQPAQLSVWCIVFPSADAHMCGTLDACGPLPPAISICTH